MIFPYYLVAPPAASHLSMINRVFFPLRLFGEQNLVSNQSLTPQSTEMGRTYFHLQASKEIGMKAQELNE